MRQFRHSEHRVTRRLEQSNAEEVLDRLLLVYEGYIQGSDRSVATDDLS